MKIQLLLLSVLLIQGSVHTARSEILSQSKAEGSAASLYCNNDGTVLWDKCTDGRRYPILRAEGGEITNKYKHDPENRYSVNNGDLSLVIKGLSVSDSGIYCCNTVPVVNLIVIPTSPPQSPPPTTAGRKGENNSTPSTDGSCCSPERSRDGDKDKLISKPKPTSPTTAKTHEDEHIYDTINDSTGPETQPETSTNEEEGSGDNPKTTAPPTTYSSSSATKPTSATSATTSVQSSTEMTPTDDPTATSSISSEVSPKPVIHSTNPSPGSASKLNHRGISIAVGVVGAALVLLAVVLMRRCFKQKAHENEHVYATIPDSAPTTQPDSAPQRVYEVVYSLAGDPDIVKLGLRNQTTEYPLIPQTENHSDLVYSTIQPVHPAVMNMDSTDLHLYTGLKNETADSPLITQTPPTQNPSDLLYSTIQPVYPAAMREDSPDLQFNTE